MQTQGRAVSPEGCGSRFQSGAASEESERRNDILTLARMKRHGKTEDRRVSAVVGQGTWLADGPWRVTPKPFQHARTHTGGIIRLRIQTGQAAEAPQVWNGQHQSARTALHGA